MLNRWMTAAALSALLIAPAGLAEERDEFHRTYPLSPDGQVSLSNVNGGAKITAWDRNDVQVDAIKTAENREKLDNTEIVVESSASSIEIKTKSRNDRDLCKVEYTVMVPRRATLRSISLVNGSIEIEGVAGDVKANSVNGKISARRLGGAVQLNTVNGKLESDLDRLDPGKSVSLNSVNGSVEVLLPAGAGAQLTASTVHGDIHSDFNIGVRRLGPEDPFARPAVNIVFPECAESALDVDDIYGIPVRHIRPADDGAQS